MSEVAVAFLAGVPVAALMTFVGSRLGLLDRPGAIKPHARPVPYTGGLALAILLGGLGPPLGVPALAVAGALLAWAVGFVDDARHLDPRLKLAAELPALVVGSFAIDLDGAVRLVAIVVGLFLINAFNVIDGLDALAGGTAAIALAALLLLNAPLAALAAVALGGVLAFLVFNLPPARLFLGDEGSLLLGYVLWLVALAAFAAAPSARLLIVTGCLWAFPLVNAGFVVLARIRAGRPVLAGDRSHLYDVLHRRLGLRGTLLVCWTIGAAGAIGAAALA